MERRGHVGIGLLAYAPFAYFFLQESQLGIALSGLIAVLAIERLPDKDFRLPFLKHRGTSHSLFCAFVVGAVLAMFGWIIGAVLTTPIANTVTNAGFSPNGLFAGVFDWVAAQIQELSTFNLAMFGFVVGTFGILVHLFGDVITAAGIQPFLPFSDYRISLSRVNSDSSGANTSLFAVGILVIAFVFFATAPNVGLATSANISPVGVASAQSANQSNASVVFENQTINGTAVTISSVTLPKGGYVALHDSSYLKEMAPKNISVIAVSRYLSPGHYENLSIAIRHSPPGGFLNKTRLNHTQRLVAVLYKETTGNHRYEFVLTFGSKDVPYYNQSTPIADPARVAVRGTRGAPGYEPPTAAVTVSNQRVNGSLSVSRARLPDGGFLVVRTASPENGSLKSVIGHSQYLTPGTHYNISVMLNASIQQRQTLVVVPARDTNENKRYDFLRTNGLQDIAYRNPVGSGAVATRVVVHSTLRTITTTTRGGTATTTPAPTTTVEDGGGVEIFGIDVSIVTAGAVILLIIISLIAIGRVGGK